MIGLRHYKLKQFSMDCFTCRQEYPSLIVSRKNIELSGVFIILFGSMKDFFFFFEINVNFICSLGPFCFDLVLFFCIQNEMECAYYMRNGQCKFGGTCKFHHPQPSNMMVPLRGSAVYPPIPSATTSQLSFPLSRASFIASPRWQSPSSYTPLVMPQGVVSVPGWNTYNVIILMN